MSGAFQAYERVVACARGGGLRWDEIAFVARGSGERARVPARDDVEATIDATWARRGATVYDAAKFRFASATTRDADATDGAIARVECGLTDYKTLQGTNLAANWDAFAATKASDDATTRTTSGCGRASAANGTAARFAHYGMALGNCV